MATSFSAVKARPTSPVPAPSQGALCVAHESVEFDTDVTLAAALTVSMVRLPARAVVVAGMVYGPDIDTGTETFDFDIGWAGNGGSGTFDAADPDGFGNLGIQSGDAVTEWKPVASILVPFQGVLCTAGVVSFTRRTTLQLVFNADAAAGGTGKMTMVAFYYVP